MAIPVWRSNIFRSLLIATALALAGAAPFAVRELRADSLQSEIAERVAALNIQPSKIDFTYKKALRVRKAIGAGNFAVASQITADVITQSQLQSWRYYPFDDFIDSVFHLSYSDFEPALLDWISGNPNDPIPLLIRAKFYYKIGWTKRGNNSSNKTEAWRITLFSNYMKKALADINAAINLDDRNPYSFYLKLIIMHGNGNSPAFWKAFEEAIQRRPTYYRLYEIALDTLQPRWGGKIPAMYDFVDKYAGNAPEFSPLKLLYLSLYQKLLSTASVNCGAFGSDRDKMAQCIVGLMQKFVKPGLEQHVLTALQLYDHTDKYQFGLAVRKLVSSMLATAGGDLYSGAMLQITANAMHSDTRLKPEGPGRSNFIVDELVAESWYYKKFYEDATTKYRQALADAKSTTFPSEEERSIELAYIYEKLSQISEKQNQYADSIVLGQAAVLLGSDWKKHYICYAYYKLKHYEDAVQTCTDAIQSTGNPYAHYWRGVAFRDSGRLDEALKDFTTVADSEKDFAASAAIAMSVIYGSRRDYQNELGVLNKYKFLYDPNWVAKSDLAVAYNNRCHAHMQLGELKKALDDCTQSLRFGSLPEAFRKQQELVKLLKAPEKGL